MCQCKMWELSVFLACFCVYSVTTFNVDSFNYNVYDGAVASMFGFSIALHKEGNNGWLIVGAPEAQSSHQGNVFRGGVVFKCPTSRDGNCEEIPFDNKGHMFDQQTGFQLDNKTEQWFGATVSSSGKPEGPIVACAPRYTWYPMKYTRRDPVGTCYVSDGLFKHFNEYSPCRTYQWGYHRQGSCQAGFSAAINSIGDRLFIGAPGSWYWQGQMYSVDAHAEFEFKPRLFSATYGDEGQVHQQSLESRPAVFSTTEGTDKDDDSYMGYSTIVGDFQGTGEEGIAVGMPRGNNLYGRVILFTWNLTDLRHFSSDQLGCYYGYALAVSDVDGDGRLDLVVGAPMYTVPNNMGKYDVGRVYVIYYHNDTVQGTFNANDTIDGFSSKSRFGQALASLGDINQDGYGDFAVGAPYDGKDNRGAVYIYHGSKMGVRKKYSQVIFAEDVSPQAPLNTFGFSLAGGLDLDGNQYPDMAIGAYLSNKAFFFRSRPVIQVDASVIFLTKNKEIDLNNIDSQRINNTDVVKTQIQFCSSYSGKGIPSSIRLNLQYILDSKVRNPRMGFVDGTGSNVKNETITLYRNRTHCSDSTVYVRSDIRDKLTPLVAEVKYWMTADDDLYSAFPERERNPRSILIPVIDLNSPPSKKDSIRIQNNCGPDKVCYPDLKLTVDAKPPQYIFNSKGKLYLEIAVSNDGEESFETTLTVKYPESLYYVNSVNLKSTQLLCSVYENHTVKCDIGNPLPNNEAVNFQLWFTPNYDYDNLAMNYFFEVSVNSTNPEKPGTVSDNAKNVSVEIISEYYQEIRQRSIPAEVFFNSSSVLYKADITKQTINTPEQDRLLEEAIGPQVIHVYYLKNEGQINIKKAEFFFVWPAYTLGGDDFFYLAEPPHISGSTRATVQCGTIPINYRDFTVIRSEKIWERIEQTKIEDEPGTSAGHVGTTPPPAPYGTTSRPVGTIREGEEEKIGSTVGGRVAKNDQNINQVVSGSDISEVLEKRKSRSRRVEMFTAQDFDFNPNYKRKRIGSVLYYCRCLEEEKEVNCGSDFNSLIDEMTVLVQQGHGSYHQRRCMMVINGKAQEIECGSSTNFTSTTSTTSRKRIQISQTLDGYGIRQRLGNTHYFYSCVDKDTGNEVDCGPELYSAINSVAQEVNRGTLYVGNLRQCVEEVNGKYQPVACHTGEPLPQTNVEKVQLFQGQTNQIKNKYQRQRIGNSQYFYRCLREIDGEEEEVDCGPDFASTIASITRSVQSGNFRITGNVQQCWEEINGQLRSVECDFEKEWTITGGGVVNLGRVEVFQGQDTYGGKYQHQRLGTTQYFYRCWKTVDGKEEEVRCGPEFSSIIAKLVEEAEEGRIYLTSASRRQCMMEVNGSLTPVHCGTHFAEEGVNIHGSSTVNARKVQIFQGDHQGGYQRIGSTRYSYRCTKTINGRDEEVDCGPEFAGEIANVTKIFQQRGTRLANQCMQLVNGKLEALDCSTLNQQQIGNQRVRSLSHICWVYDESKIGSDKWKTLDCGSSELLSSTTRRCFEVVESRRQEEISCEEAVRLYQQRGQTTSFQSGYGGSSSSHQQYGTNYGYGSAFNASYGSAYGRGSQQGRRDPHTYGTYGGSRSQVDDYGLNRAALGGGLQTQVLHLGDIGGDSSAHWSESQPLPESDNYVGRDNVPTDRPQKPKKWVGRRKRQVFDTHPTIAEIRKRFDCKSAHCGYVRCTVENLEHGKEISVGFRGRLNARVLKNVSLTEPMTFSTLLAARVIESLGPTVKQELIYQEASTTVKEYKTEFKSEMVPLWVVVLSAVAGTIILLLLVFLLYKVGFFKRNRPSSAPERQPLNRNGYHHGDEVL